MDWMVDLVSSDLILNLCWNWCLVFTLLFEMQHFFLSFNQKRLIFFFNCFAKTL